MSHFQESLGFAYPLPDPELDAVMPATAQQPEYDQLTIEQPTIPYANESEAVIELLITLGTVAADTVAYGEETEAIKTYNRYNPEEPWRDSVSDALRRAKLLQHDIEYAVETIEASGGDLDVAIATLERRHREIDSRLSDDVLPSHVGSRERPTARLIEESRKPFDIAGLYERAENIRPFFIYNNYGLAVRWLFANMDRLRDQRDPLPWNGTDTTIYFGTSIGEGQIAPQADYIWIGQVGRAKNMELYDFTETLLPPKALRGNDPWA